MVEITPEFVEKSKRLRALESDPSATAREAIELLLWFNEFDARVVDWEMAESVVGVLQRTGLDRAERAELIEHCLRSLLGAHCVSQEGAWTHVAEHVLKV